MNDHAPRASVQTILRSGSGAIILALVASMSQAAIYYVDPVLGADGNDGLSESRPVRTVGDAIAVGQCVARATTSATLCPGDVVRMRAGVDHPPTGFPATLAGTAQQPIMVEPYGGDRIVIDARTRVPDFAVTGVAPLRWELAPGGAPDEWRSIILNDPATGTLEPGFAFDREVYGQLMDAGHRLVSYSRLEDFRAANQSFPGGGVPLADPRPAGGPLKDAPDRKQPWTYLGPGIFWMPEAAGASGDPRGRIHLRLAPTTFRARGITDFGPAGIDPNNVRIALTSTRRVAVTVGASHLVLRNVAIRNGGDTTLEVNANAANVTLHGCEVQGARNGVRVSGGARSIRFEHCTFDGGLAPWTTRLDVKSEYTYLAAGGEETTNGLGRITHDILVIDHGADSVFSHCTFRRAHDAIQLAGGNTVVRDSLFEDINDEVVQFNGATNVQVFRNLIRQALHPFSFALNRTGGPVHVFRNVVDQRLPTRGYRALPPDAPRPHVWRHGTDFKMAEITRFNGQVVDSMPPAYVYQNTFIASHPDDKASVLTQFFASNDVSPGMMRLHQNNLRIGLALDVPLSWAMPTDFSRASRGNLWHLPHRANAPWFKWVGPPVANLDSLAAVQARGWEIASIAADPRLARFDDEYFENGPVAGEGFPNTDYRLAADSPARAAGVPLQVGLPDSETSSGNPDIGALPFGAAPFAVGAFGRVVAPIAGVPIANAGPDRTIADAGDDGFETVTLDGSASVSGGAPLTSHTWSVNDIVSASTPVATVRLPAGDHYVRLRVSDSAGNVDTDAAHLRIVPGRPHGDNVLACPGFEESPCGWRLRNARITTATAHTGSRALRLTNGAASSAVQRIAVHPDAPYRVSLWSRRASGVGAGAQVLATYYDGAGVVIGSVTQTLSTGTSYTYAQAAVRTPATAVALELQIGSQPGTGPLDVDDIRVTDANVLRNAGFEMRPPNGRDTESPAWTFERGGVVATAVDAIRSGARSLALAGGPEYRQVTQSVRPLPAATRYRVAAWVRTVGLSVAPTIEARFDRGSDQALETTLAPGGFRHFSRTVTAPAGASELTLTIRLPGPNGVGTAYIDDVLVEPLD